MVEVLRKVKDRIVAVPKNARMSIRTAVDQSATQAVLDAGPRFRSENRKLLGR